MYKYKFAVKRLFSSGFLQGIVFKKQNKLDDALDCFHKFQAILPNHPECLYQLANWYPFTVLRMKLKNLLLLFGIVHRFQLCHNLSIIDIFNISSNSLPK